jgi:hypothetical protein
MDTSTPLKKKATLTAFRCYDTAFGIVTVVLQLASKKTGTEI